MLNKTHPIHAALFFFCFAFFLASQFALRLPVACPPPPDPPTLTGLQALSPSAQRLTWSQSYGASEYRIYRSTNGSSFSFLQTAYSTTADIGGLSAGTRYWYRVTAWNSSGESGYSNTLDGWTKPEAPTIESVQSKSAFSLEVTWQAVTGATLYKVYRSVSSGGPYDYEGQTTSLTYEDSGLDAGTRYYYKVAASNTGGDSELSVAGNNWTRPFSPELTTLTATSISAMSLQWGAVASATTYKIYRRGAEDYEYSLLTQTSNLTHSDTNLSSNTQYSYRLSAINAGGESAFSIQKSNSTLPLPPQGPTVTAQGPNTIRISWQPNPKIERRAVYRSSSAQGTYVRISPALWEDSYVDDGLTTNTQYFYKLAAVNMGGESDLSSAQSGTTLERDALSVTAPSLGTLAIDTITTLSAAGYPQLDGATYTWTTPADSGLKFLVNGVESSSASGERVALFAKAPSGTDEGTSICIQYAGPANSPYSGQSTASTETLTVTGIAMETAGASSDAKFDPGIVIGVQGIREASISLLSPQPSEGVITCTPLLGYGYARAYTDAYCSSEIPSWPQSWNITEDGPPPSIYIKGISPGRTEFMITYEHDGLRCKDIVAYNVETYPDNPVIPHRRVPSAQYPTIQSAINASSSGNVIMVEPGTYSESIDFNGKNIILESTDAANAAVMAATILSGNRQGPAVQFDGTETAQCVIQGFTITNGQSNYGGGICGKESQSPTSTHAGIFNNLIYGNFANVAGGGMAYCDGSILYNVISYNDGIREGAYSMPVIYGGAIAYSAGLIAHNHFECNVALGGGAISDSTASILGNTFTANYALFGGAVAACEANIINNTFLRNWAGAGGALSLCSGQIYNNLIARNTAFLRGGGIHDTEGNIVNNTIAYNTAEEYGGGIAECGGASVKNCILWRNGAPTDPQIYGDLPTMTFNCVQDWFTDGSGAVSTVTLSTDAWYAKGSQNMIMDPLFADPQNDDFRLPFYSPCVDRGGQPLSSLDKDGNYRYAPAPAPPASQLYYCDIGAFEVKEKQLGDGRGEDIVVSPDGHDLPNESSMTLWEALADIEAKATANQIPKGGITVWMKDHKTGGVKHPYHVFDETILPPSTPTVGIVLGSNYSGGPDRRITFRSYPGESARIVGGLPLKPSWFTSLANTPGYNRFKEDNPIRSQIMALNLSSNRDINGDGDSSGYGNQIESILNYMGYYYKWSLPYEMKPRGRVQGSYCHPAARVELFAEGKRMQLARYPDREENVQIPSDSADYLKGFLISGEFLPYSVYQMKIPLPPGGAVDQGAKVQIWSWDDDANMSGIYQVNGKNQIWISGHFFALGWQALLDLANISRSVETDPTGLVKFYTGPGYTYAKDIQQSPDSYKSRPFYLLNILEEITEPGEYYIDWDEEYLYLYPEDELDEDSFLLLSGCTTPLIRFENASNITLRDLTIEGGRGELVQINGGRDILIADCEIRGAGTTAVDIDGGRNHGLVGCEISHCGERGVAVAGGDRMRLIPSEHFVRSNDIHHFGQLGETNRAGIAIDKIHPEDQTVVDPKPKSYEMPVGCVASNNYIHDGPSGAIFYGGNDHLIELNRITTVCTYSADDGATYSGRNWDSRGNVVKHNLVYNIKSRIIRNPYVSQAYKLTHAFYLDDGDSGDLLIGNIAYGLDGYGLFAAGGRDNFAINSIFDYPMDDESQQGGSAQCYPISTSGGYVIGTGSSLLYWDSRDLLAKVLSLHYNQPPWSDRYPALAQILDEDIALSHTEYTEAMKGKGCKINRCIGDPEHKFNNAYLHRFESEGADFVLEEFSRFFHPSFTDPANGDFSAKLSPTDTGYPPGEAAQNAGYGEIGFRKIPIYDVGPYR